MRVLKDQVIGLTAEEAIEFATLLLAAAREHINGVENAFCYQPMLRHSEVIGQYSSGMVFLIEDSQRA